MLPREPDAAAANHAPHAGAASAPREGAANFDRWNHGAWIFRDEMLLKIEILLDEALSGCRTDDCQVSGATRSALQSIEVIGA